MILIYDRRKPRARYNRSYIHKNYPSKKFYSRKYTEKELEKYFKKLKKIDLNKNMSDEEKRIAYSDIYGSYPFKSGRARMYADNFKSINRELYANSSDEWNRHFEKHKDDWYNNYSKKRNEWDKNYNNKTKK